MKTLSSFKLSLLVLASTLSWAPAQVIFWESFEAPGVTGFDGNTTPVSGWVGASQGFGATNRGLFNETVAWPDTPEFSTPFGDQAYLLNYSNSGLTTSQGAISGVLTQDEPYTVSFNVAVEVGTTSGGYIVEFLAFDPEDDNDSRKNAQGGRPGTVLAKATGTVTTNDMSNGVSLEFTPEAGDANLGKEMGLRLLKGSGSVLYDNIRFIVGHDLAPSPADGVTVAGGDVTLAWTNHTPNVGSDVFVDVWFGTDPESDFSRLVTGGVNSSSTTVSAPVADAYYWRVDSYLEGNPSGTPVESRMFAFYVTDTDNDGFPDSYELANTNPPSAIFLNPNDDLENGGAGDGLTNLQEFQFGTDPNEPDSDGDNLEDGAEIAGAGLRPATNPLDSDSDNDGLNDDLETNTMVWVGPSDTGTDPTDADQDKDGLKDGVESNTGIFVNVGDTGTDPYSADSDGDGSHDWYEVVATFTSPLDPLEKPEVPYPLPDPDGTSGATDKPVKIYIMSGQSNTVGIGYVNGGAGSLTTIAKKENKFPNLVDDSNAWTERKDVWYEGVVTATAKKWLTAGCGADGTRIGPELGFGHIMGFYHDEPVIIIKASQGNRSLGWDFLPPGSPQYTFGPDTYAGYQDSPLKWLTGSVPEPVGWYAGKQYDDCFTEVHDVLDNFATKFPQYADQGYEIAGFVWWQGHKDQYEAAHYERYEDNLTGLIDGLRMEFDAPNAPFVVGSIGFDGGGYDAGSAYGEIYAAQMAVGDSEHHPEYAGTVNSVDTTPFWRELNDSPGGQGFHYNNNAETYMLVGDAMGRAMLDLLDDVSPPAPNPMTFSIEPTAVDASTIGMVSTTAGDPSGPVEYYFENTSNGDNSGWISTTGWQNSGLGGGSYSYRVKARDAKGNETDWSGLLSASPGSDVTAPSPDPMGFAAPPASLGQSSIAMEASLASDINGVEYYFHCLSAGGHDSAWQDSASYTDMGLMSGTEYVYQVRARDKSSGQNTTAYSGQAAAMTTAPDLEAPSISNLSPVNGATGVDRDSELVVIFDEPIAAGSGLITIENLGDGSLTLIDISDGTQVAIVDSVLTINPSVSLAEGQEYAVLIAGTAVDDLVGNSFLGIDLNTAWRFRTQSPPPLGLLLSEDFESPDVDKTAGDGDTNGTLPNNGKWVGANQGFGASRRGITDKAGEDFGALDPNMQAFAFRYTNSGLTTAEGAIGTLAANATYSVSFDVVRDAGRGNGTPYTAQLVAFSPGVARNDTRASFTNLNILATAAGNAPDDGSWSMITFEYTPEAGDPNLGKDIGLRFLGTTTSAIIDNVQVSSGGGGGDNTFSSWIAGFTGLGGLTGFADDPDGDGLANGLENYLGSDPGKASLGLQVESMTGNQFLFSHPLNETPADDIEAAYQWSLDLEDFHGDGALVEGTSVSFAPGEVSDGAVIVTATISGPVPEKLFMNLSVSQQP